MAWLHFLGGREIEASELLQGLGAVSTARDLGLPDCKAEAASAAVPCNAPTDLPGD